MNELDQLAVEGAYMIDERGVTEGIRHRRVEAQGPNGMVPGVMYSPEGDAGPLPLVLLGHGGAGGKDQDPPWVSLGRFLARSVPAAVLCIDGPVHGERAPAGGTLQENFRATRRAISDPKTIADFAQDWRASVDEARTAGDVDPERLGYIGFSMGTMFGIPTCAALGEVRAAVFALGGVPQKEGLADLIRSVDPEAAKIAGEELERDKRGEEALASARKLEGTEVLMLNMTKDQVFSMSGALELFDAFPGPKRIAAWEGGHVELPREGIGLAAAFLSRVLGPDTADEEELWRVF